MSLTALFKQKTVFSLEVFPPKKDSPTDAILPTLKRLQSLQPDFISVTLGAGGTNHCDGTVAVADLIQNQLNIPAVSHVPGLYQSKDQVLALLDRLDQIHVKNILALRGDRIPGKEPVGDFNLMPMNWSNLSTSSAPISALPALVIPTATQRQPTLSMTLATSRKKWLPEPIT